MEDLRIGHILNLQESRGGKLHAAGVGLSGVFVEDGIVIVIEVGYGADAQLAQIAGILGGMTSLENFLINRQSDTGENCDNGDDDEQFDKSKSGGFLHGGKLGSDG